MPEHRPSWRRLSKSQELMKESDIVIRRCRIQTGRPQERPVLPPETPEQRAQREAEEDEIRRELGNPD